MFSVFGYKTEDIFFGLRGAFGVRIRRLLEWGSIGQERDELYHVEPRGVDIIIPSQEKSSFSLFQRVILISIIRPLEALISNSLHA
jgi:hypothetical protein